MTEDDTFEHLKYRIEVIDGITYYYNSAGKYHREDGPAVFNNKGYKEWWVNGNLHREDGPAFVNPQGINEYWINNQCLTEREFLERTKK